MATNVTRKQLVNKVLRKLREDQLTSAQNISDVPYAELIADFINDVKEEVEDAWNWSQLRVFMDFNTTAGNSRYNIGDADLVATTLVVIDSDGNEISVGDLEGYNFADASNERSQIFSIWNTTEDYRLTKVSDAFMNRHTLIGTQQNSSPQYWRMRGFDNDGNLIVELYPVPNASHSMRAWCYIPQEPLTTDTSVLVLSAAEKAIIYGTWAMAISERGEDGGQLYDEVAKKYEDYLNTAIARDKEHFDTDYMGSEGDWVVV